MLKLLSPNSAASDRSRRETQWFFAFFLAALFLWGISLGNVPLRDWDEGTRALIAREIYRTGNWLYPTLQGEPYLLKPPLMDWLIALSYKLGGVGEFTTRLPVAFFSACGVPLLYGVGRKLFNQRLPAIFSAGVYLTLLPVVRHGRLAMLDGTVVTFFLLLLLCLLNARQDRRWAVGIGISLGLIGFTKGILVILLSAIALLFLLADRQLGFSDNKNLLPIHHSSFFWLGILLGGVPILAWYLAQWHYYGVTFWQVHFQSQGLNRISKSVEGNSGSPWYYLLELLKYTFPWLLFWFGGLLLAWQNRQKTWGKLVLIGTVGYLGAISVMSTKLPWYIMPLYPFFALAVGANLAYFWKNNKNYPRILVGILGFIAVAALGGCVYFVLADPQAVLIVMGIVVALTMGWAAWHVYQHNRMFIPILLGGMYVALTLLMLSQSWVWELNEAFPVKPVAALIRSQTAPGTAIYTSFAYRRPSLDFYSDRQIIPQDTQTLQELSSTPAYLLLDDSTLTTLQLSDRVALGTAGGFTLIGGE
ncbi:MULTISPECIES: ArnT family glycosyltransferase [unclassified Coleofasciculus]|uniref:ArnT family glycosyltransferase n=1 Tax=unclassified Coleofasciculus TaxID=2692782 RepID=UPI0018829662|nr:MULTISPECIES: glycosyltransferase family 39 protein [unclassified Coleofasciculus]MBE9124977.1 glycosyltransferase family 39 protein [Coleofasciculus sp. LEGE 07081]MBE9148001.1 glycosyltransferase family 39 protein [Coleofasciculus sp. LEGE 07092]